MTEQLSENSHQGFDGIKAALCLASTRVNSNTASEMPVCLWQNGIRSRSTGKERDAETGLDYFGARYLSSAQGRFTSTDPVISGPHKLNDPQNWNLYSYARNNPLRYTDPSGEIIEEQIDEEYRKRYEQWKKDYLSTEAGRKQWASMLTTPIFTLTITVNKSKGKERKLATTSSTATGLLRPPR